MDNPKEMADPKSTIKIEKNDDEETTADCNTASNIDVAQSDVKIEESSLKVKKESPTQESSQIDYSQASSSQMVTHTDKKETHGARKHALSDEPRTSTDSGDNTAPPKPKRQKMTEPIDPYEHDMEIVLEPCSNVMHIDKDLPSEGYTEHPDCSRGSTSSRVTGNSVSGNDANGEDHDGQNGNAQNPHEHGGQGDQPADDNQDEDDSEEEEDDEQEEDDDVDDDDDDDDDNDDDDEEDESEDDDTDTDGEGAGDQNPPVQSVEQVAADEASYVEVGAGDGAKNVPEESTVAKGEGGHIGDTKLPKKDDDVGQDADEPNDDLDADIFQQQAQPVEVEAVVHAEEQNNANQDGNNGDVGLNNENQGQNNEVQNNEGQNNEGHAEEQNNANQDGYNGDVGLNNENQGQNNEDQNNEDQNNEGQNEQNNDEPEIIAEFIDMGGAGDAGINQLMGDDQEDPEEEQDEVDSIDEEMGEFHMVDDAGDAPADLAIDAPEAEEDDVMGPDPLLMAPHQDFPLMDPEPPVMVPDPHIPLMNPYPAYPEPPLMGLPHEAEDNDSFDWNDSSDDEEETDDEEEEEDEPHQVGEHGEPGDGPPPPNMGGDPEADGGANAPEQGGGANPPAQDPPVDPASVGGGIGAGDAPLADDAHQLDSTMNESNSSHLDHVKNSAINHKSAAKQNNTNRKDINCISEDKNLDQVSPLDSKMLNPELKINNPANKQSAESITEQSSQSAALKADDNGEDLRQLIVNLEKLQSPLAERSSVSLSTCELCGPTQQCLRLRRNSVIGRVTRRGRGRPRSNENVSTENASYTCLLRRKVMQDRESGRKHVQTSHALKEHKTHDKCSSDEITEEDANKDAGEWKLPKRTSKSLDLIIPSFLE